MQWIKASERRPGNPYPDHRFKSVQICFKYPTGHMNVSWVDTIRRPTFFQQLIDNDCFWLDDSPSPSLPETEQGNERFLEEMTALMREADQQFENVGGSTRHYMRDIFLPMMEEKGLLIVKRHSKIETTEPMPEFNESIETMDADSKIFVDKSMAIASRIKQCLNERGMQQKDLASLLGKTDAEISKWLAGMHNLTLRTLSKMEAALGCDIIHISNPSAPPPDQPVPEEVPEFESIWDAWGAFEKANEEHHPMGVDLRPEATNGKNIYVFKRAAADWGAKWMREALQGHIDCLKSEIQGYKKVYKLAKDERDELQSRLSSTEAERDAIRKAFDEQAKELEKYRHHE